MPRFGFLIGEKTVYLRKRLCLEDELFPVIIIASLGTTKMSIFMKTLAVE